MKINIESRAPPGVYTIQGVSVVESRFGKRYQVDFEGGKTRLLNYTSLKTLCDAYGDDSDGWKSKQVQVTTKKMLVRGEMRDVTFVMPSKQKREKGRRAA